MSSLFTVHQEWRRDTLVYIKYNGTIRVQGEVKGHKGKAIKHSHSEGLLWMTYNFDPERWYENEYSALEVLYKEGKLSDTEFNKSRSDLVQRYEEMLSRLDGTYQVPKWKPAVKGKGSVSRLDINIAEDESFWLDR